MKSILTVNVGSSSIRFQVIAMPNERQLLDGKLERIGDEDALLKYSQGGNAERTQRLHFLDHETAIQTIIEVVHRVGYARSDIGLSAVGHRVVHGGEEFTRPVRIDRQAISKIEALSQLAPLHNSLNLAGINAIHDAFPDLPQVAVFDTAFHHNLPEPARSYAIPLKLQRDHRIRRYGFHGISHQYVAESAAQWLNRPLIDLRLISLHLGNGASACAIHRGQSVDTSMGFTPLEGLIMGSRCGDLDPAIPGYLARSSSLSPTAVDQLLIHESGLLGLCGDNDMRRIEQRMPRDTEAQLAFDMFCYRVRKYIGAYYAVLNGLDAVLLTAGIGENSSAVRAAVCGRLDALGIAVDPDRNDAVAEGIVDVSDVRAPVRVLVVPTDEAIMIARATYSALYGPYR